jgi:hypothetical protein
MGVACRSLAPHHIYTMQGKDLPVRLANNRDDLEVVNALRLVEQVGRKPRIRR